ncbi:hypothetical protein [Burkholderia gladioli]|uniref:hypothetical protein n=1 Tax=Burkholderia gladioli TaxID=28095 RepID=UPI00163FEBAE|nr:hypothetical protein [Burkholderia gladioli]
MANLSRGRGRRPGAPVLDRLGRRNREKWVSNSLLLRILLAWEAPHTVARIVHHQRIAILGTFAMQILNDTTSVLGNQAAGSSTKGPSGSGSPSFQSVLDKLNAYLNETPAQRMEDSMLAQLGITPEQLKAMSPAEREKVEAQVRDLMKKEMDAQRSNSQTQTQTNANSSTTKLDLLA